MNTSFYEITNFHLKKWRFSWKPNLSPFCYRKMAVSGTDIIIFKIIFAEKIQQKIGVFYSKQS
jgi:hypothetical protein